MENKLAFTVPDHCDGMTALTFLKKQCGVSTRMITHLKREKDGILRNGTLLKTIDILKTGDRVVLKIPKDNSSIVPVKGKLDIVYEDDYILAVNKPPQMPVHPTKVHQLNTLANTVAFYAQSKGETYTFRAVNRLDKDTSGIVLIAKNAYTASNLNKSVSKVYYCVCSGIITEKLTVSKPIAIKEGHTIQRTVTADGKSAVTHIEPVKIGDDYTLLRVILETGRTHQIRCHLSSIGHPLLGDDMYGGSLDKINRQALHCKTVTFIHPITKITVELKTPLPDDFKRIID